MVFTEKGPQNFRKSSTFCFGNMFFSNLTGFRNMLCFLFKKTEEPNSKTLPRPRMKFLFKPQFSFSDNGNLYNILVLLVQSLLVLFCALLPPLVVFFRYFKTPANKESLFEEDFHEALQESIDFDEIETPFSALSFRFPTYDEFLRTTETVDSVRFDTSSENLEENCSIPLNPDPDFNLNPSEEDFPPNGLNCTNDIEVEDLNIIDDDEFDDSVEAISGSFDRKIEDSDEIESEEDDFIKQLQIELMKAKAKAKYGLPSIPEESEYPVTKEEDLMPWKKEESFNHRDITKELHRFHKLYAEKMRKYDTLNRQKTFSKELKMMQSKDSVDSVLSKGLCGCMPDKKADAKTGENREIYENLELVYVVQLWVSWEFIVWQYKKALEMCCKEGYQSCRYNEVAGKFQHFQVMIQRFMENESFDEGSRVECYARIRLARRKLLQVPLLKEDGVEDNKNRGGIDDGEKENAVKMDRLIKMLQESIRILWHFIRADKLAHISTLKCHIETERECTSPARSRILKQILLDLQKKERKLKKIIRRKDCMLKNCKEISEDDPEPDDELCFLAMVDLKLVSRALNMQLITRDQLKWCHHKLSCISFPNGKIQLEPSSVLLSS